MIRTALITLALFALPASAPLAQDGAAGDDDIPCGYLCVDGVMLDTSGTMPDTEVVKQIFLGAFSERCSWAVGGGPGLYEPEIHDLTYRASFEGPDGPERALRLYRIFCGAGAYNEQHVYLSWTELDGVRVQGFAVPEFDYTISGEEPAQKLETLKLLGMGSRQVLVNSIFDPESGAVTEMSCWRGLCDASSRGKWVLADGEFRLVSFDVDPTYDGEITLYRVADFGAPAAMDLSAPVEDIAPQMQDGYEEAEE